MTELVLSVGFVVAVFLLPIAIATGVIAMLLLASSAAAPIFEKWEDAETPDPRLYFAGLNGFAIVDYTVPAQSGKDQRPSLSTSLVIRRADFHPS